MRVAAASAKGGPGSARGRLVARGAVAVTCWLHPLSSSVMCSRFPRRADLFALCGVAVRRVQAKADEAAAAAGSKSGG